MSDERFDRIEEWQATANERFHRIDRRFDAVETHMKTGFAELRRHMGALYDDTLRRIAGIGEGFPRLEAKMDQRFAELTEVLGRRLDPLEAAVRHQGAEINELKKRRG